MMSLLENRPPKKNKQKRLEFRSKEIKKKLEEMARISEMEEEGFQKGTNKEATVTQREDHEKEKGELVNVDKDVKKKVKKKNEAIEKGTNKEATVTQREDHEKEKGELVNVNKDVKKRVKKKNEAIEKGTNKEA